MSTEEPSVHLTGAELGDEKTWVLFKLPMLLVSFPPWSCPENQDDRDCSGSTDHIVASRSSYSTSHLLIPDRNACRSDLTFPATRIQFKHLPAERGFEK